MVCARFDYSKMLDLWLATCSIELGTVQADGCLSRETDFVGWKREWLAETIAEIVYSVELGSFVALVEIDYSLYSAGDDLNAVVVLTSQNDAMELGLVLVDDWP